MIRQIFMLLQNSDSERAYEFSRTCDNTILLACLLLSLKEMILLFLAPSRRACDRNSPFLK